VASVVIDQDLLSALVKNVIFQGKSHGKCIFANVSGTINPHNEWGRKHIEYLTDDDTDIYALDAKGKAYLMGDWFTFVRALEKGVSFTCAFTLPRGLKDWREYAALPHDSIDRQFAVT
jgi:hypothetical protein